jgi:hypothetical protein
MKIHAFSVKPILALLTAAALGIGPARAGGLDDILKGLLKPPPAETPRQPATPTAPTQPAAPPRPPRPPPSRKSPGTSC